MRWVGVVGLAVGVAGCVRLNPGYGDEGGTGTGGMSGESTTVDPTDPVSTTEPNGTTGTSASGSSSDAGSTGQPPGEYVCGADQWSISVMPPPPGCLASGGGDSDPVAIDAVCMSVRNDGGVLHAASATGCEPGVCNILNPQETSFSAGSIDLGAATGLGNEAQCRFIWAYGYPINDDGEGRCRWDAFAVWSTAGELEIAVGNGLPDDGLPGQVGRPEADGVPVTSTIITPTTCGGLVDECDRSGWRAFEFGTMLKHALPDGVAMPATWDGQEWSVVNHGLQLDLACDRFGRWGVVRRGFESVIE